VTHCASELTERMETASRKLGLEVKLGKTGRNYRPPVLERGVSYSSGIGIWNSSRGVEFNLQTLRELGRHAIADDPLLRLETTTGTRGLPPNWPPSPAP
jgi:hypothetical protein